MESNDDILMSYCDVRYDKKLDLWYAYTNDSYVPGSLTRSETSKELYRSMIAKIRDRMWTTILGIEHDREDT